MKADLQAHRLRATDVKDIAELYPPSPGSVPSDFTRPTSGYRLRVVLVLGSLLFSFLLYLALLLGSLWLCTYLIRTPWASERRDGGATFLRIVFIVASGLLFLYLLKGLFKGSRRDETFLVEIEEKDQPQLFAFIRRVCAETKAPFPRKVYLSPEVNAFVFYHSSLLSLFLPTSKNLAIGLGLVNMLNLSEFKAVLAHEFGHFSQKSMKVGSYVYVANQVLVDIIYGRDFMDDILRHAKSLDIRIAVFVYAFLGVLWGIRKLLEGIFRVINLSNLALMRQMEFNADRVAVSAAGSDPVVHCLLRASFADLAFRQLSNDLWSAADHNLYSRDIFYHQAAAGEQVRRLSKKPDLGKPPTELGPEVQVFKHGEDDPGIASMWATHPSNPDRERNAKETYLPVPIDQRSCWELFSRPEEIRFEVTRRYYQVAHKLDRYLTFSEPEKVQQFFDEEYAETTYGEHYAGLYDNRYLEIPSLDPLLSEAGLSEAPEVTRHKLKTMTGPDLASWVEAYQKRGQEFDLLTGVVNGSLRLKGPRLEIRGQSYSPSDAPRLLEQIKQEFEDDRQYLADMDRRVFVCHCRLARSQSGREQELIRRYRFHLAIQEMHRFVMGAIGLAQDALNYGRSRSELSQDEFANVRQMLSESAGLLHEVLNRARGLEVPALRNMPAGTPLRGFLLQKSPVRHLGGMETTIEPQWVSELMSQLGELMDKTKRLLFKSLGGILQLQEMIVADSGRERENAAPLEIPSS